MILLVFNVEIHLLTDDIQGMGSICTKYCPCLDCCEKSKKVKKKSKRTKSKPKSMTKNRESDVKWEDSTSITPSEIHLSIRKSQIIFIFLVLLLLSIKMIENREKKVFNDFLSLCFVQLFCTTFGTTSTIFLGNFLHNFCLWNAQQIWVPRL